MTQHTEKFPQDKYSIRPVTQPMDAGCRNDPVLNAKERGQPGMMQQNTHHSGHRQDR